GITCGIVIEEGFAIAELWRLPQSIGDTCLESRTAIVAGYTKGMRRGELDCVVINTAGVGLVRRAVRDSGAAAGDAIIVTGTIGDHGMAGMGARNQFQCGDTIASDVAPLNGLIRGALAVGGAAIHAMKDPTR